MRLLRLYLTNLLLRSANYAMPRPAERGPYYPPYTCTDISRRSRAPHALTGEGVARG